MREGFTRLGGRLPSGSEIYTALEVALNVDADAVTLSLRGMRMGTPNIVGGEIRGFDFEYTSRSVRILPELSGAHEHEAGHLDIEGYTEQFFVRRLRSTYDRLFHLKPFGRDENRRLGSIAVDQWDDAISINRLATLFYDGLTGHGRFSGIDQSNAAQAAFGAARIQVAQRRLIAGLNWMAYYDIMNTH